MYYGFIQPLCLFPIVYWVRLCFFNSVNGSVPAKISIFSYRIPVLFAIIRLSPPPDCTTNPAARFLIGPYTSTTNISTTSNTFTTTLTTRTNTTTHTARTTAYAVAILPIFLYGAPKNAWPPEIGQIGIYMVICFPIYIGSCCHPGYPCRHHAAAAASPASPSCVPQMRVTRSRGCSPDLRCVPRLIPVLRYRSAQAATTLCLHGPGG